MTFSIGFTLSGWIGTTLFQHAGSTIIIFKNEGILRGIGVLISRATASIAAE